MKCRQCKVEITLANSAGPAILFCKKCERQMRPAQPEPPNQMDDTSLMPFGIHRNKPMSDVPANYFHYLWTNGMREDQRSPVADYIRRNLDALKMENRDAIWD